MMTYTKKAQVLLTEEEYKTLEEFAVRTKKEIRHPYKRSSGKGLC